MDSNNDWTLETIYFQEEAATLLGYPVAHWMNAFRLRDSGSVSQAIPEYRAAIQLRPESADLHNDFAWALATKPNGTIVDYEEAISLAKKAVGLSPDSSCYWHTLGIAQYRAGNWNEAIRSVEKSVELSKGGTSYDWFVLSMAHWRRRNHVEARKCYDKAIMWMERNELSHQSLRELIGFQAEAAELLGVAAETAPAPNVAASEQPQGSKGAPSGPTATEITADTERAKE